MSKRDQGSIGDAHAEKGVDSTQHQLALLVRVALGGKLPASKDAGAAWFQRSDLGRVAHRFRDLPPLSQLPPNIRQADPDEVGRMIASGIRDWLPAGILTSPRNLGLTEHELALMRMLALDAGYGDLLPLKEMEEARRELCDADGMFLIPIKAESARKWRNSASDKIARHLLAARGLTAPSVHLLHPLPRVRDLIGRTKEVNWLSDWHVRDSPVAMVHGPEGLGKTSVVATWLATVETSADPPLVFFWSFDEDHSYLRFREELERRLELDEQLNETDPVARIVASLPSQSILVLDGLEKMLSAYVSGETESTLLPTSALRQPHEPELGRLLSLLSAQRRSRVVATTRIAPYSWVDETGPRPGVEELPLGLLTSSDAEALVRTIAPRLRDTELRDVVRTSRSPHTLSFLAGLVRSGRLRGEQISAAREQPVDGPGTVGSDNHAVHGVLLRHLPIRLHRILAAGSLLGGVLRTPELDSINYAVDDQSGFTEGARLATLQSITVRCIPFLGIGTYAHDSGGIQTNPFPDVSEPTDELLVGADAMGLVGAPTLDRLIVDLTDLARLGLVVRDEQSWVVTPSARSALKIESSTRSPHALAMADYSARLLRFAGSENERLRILVRIFRLLVAANECELASDLLFGRIVDPLFFGTADYALLSELVSLLDGDPGETPGVPNPHKVAHRLAFRGRLETKNGLSRRAVDTWDTHLSIRKSMGDLNNVAAGKAFLGADLTLLGDLTRSVTVLEEALTTLDECPPSQPIMIQRGMTVSFLMNALIALGDLRTAKKALDDAEDCWAAVGLHAVGQCNLHLDQATLWLSSEDPDEAARHATAAMQMAERHGYMRGRILSLHLLSACGLTDGGEEPVALATKSLNLARVHRFAELDPQLLVGLALASLASGDLAACTKHADAALELATLNRYRPVAAQAQLALMHAARTRGDNFEAHRNDALKLAFGPRWEGSAPDGIWAANWRTRCAPDPATSLDGSRYRLWDWNCGYWPVMAGALEPVR